VPLYDPLHPENTWRLRKGIDFEFPQGLAIPPGGYLLVVSFDPQTIGASRAGFESVYGNSSLLVGPYRGKLDNGGESIELQKPDPPQTLPGPDFGKVPYVVVERIDYDDTAPWPLGADGTGWSLQRVDPGQYGNEPLNWVAATPGPGPFLGADTDGDGMPDQWEQDHNLNPADPTDAGQDADGDGVNNLDEYRSGTNPRDGQSYLRCLSVQWVGDRVRIQFEAGAGRSYSVQYASEMPAQTWFKLQDVFGAGAPGVVGVEDPDPAQTRFYRIVTPWQQ